ncbi:MAG: pseudouridine synthase [Vicinamibacterales bacterium]
MITLDDLAPAPVAWRFVLLNKPRNTVTTSRDPEGRRTVYDVLGEAGRRVKTVGRLDFASSGLLLLTTDMQLANWLADPSSALRRTYVATIRGRADETLAARAMEGVRDRGELLRASSVALMKVSGRESRLRVELAEGKNREIRRLFAALGHEVTRLIRVAFGPFELGDLLPGQWRELSRQDVDRALAALTPASTRQSARRHGDIAP